MHSFYHYIKEVNQFLWKVKVQFRQNKRTPVFDGKFLYLYNCKKNDIIYVITFLI
jgi:hypothetical protein